MLVPSLMRVITGTGDVIICTNFTGHVLAVVAPHITRTMLHMESGCSRVEQKCL
jgi:hypothetical protein